MIRDKTYTPCYILVPWLFTFYPIQWQFLSTYYIPAKIKIKKKKWWKDYQSKMTDLFYTFSLCFFNKWFIPLGASVHLYCRTYVHHKGKLWILWTVIQEEKNPKESLWYLTVRESEGRIKIFLSNFWSLMSEQMTKPLYQRVFVEKPKQRFPFKNPSWMHPFQWKDGWEPEKPGIDIWDCDIEVATEVAPWSPKKQ